MNEMENFIDFLASKGVKSFHIEMQARELGETQERNIERTARIRTGGNLAKACPAQAALAKHDIPVHRGEETVPAIAPRTVPLVEIEKALPAKVVNPDETAVKSLDEKATVTATQDRAKQPVPELTITQANASVKANAETTGSIAVENINPKKLYDTLCAKITTDDGTFTVEERTGLIGRMGLDDLLRINNDFSLGLDTDKAVEDVREDVKNCFR